MYRPWYSDIGAKFEKSALALKELKNKKICRKKLLEEAYKLISHCKNTLEGELNFNLLNPNYWGIYDPLLFGDLNLLGKIPDGDKILFERIYNINRTKFTLEKIMLKEKVTKKEIEGGIKTFEELGEQCIHYSCYPFWL